MLTYVAVSRSQTQHRFITGCLTLLFCIIACQVGIQWYYTFTAFGGHAEDRLTIFILSSGGISAPVVTILTFLLLGLGQITADGLMVQSISIFREFY